MSRCYFWGVVVVADVFCTFLTAMVFGLLLATVLTLVMTLALLAAPTVFREARAARRERKIIANMVKAASEGKPFNYNTQVAAAMKHPAE